MAESGVSVSNSTECGDGEIVELMGTTSSSTGAHKHSQHVTAFEGGMSSSGCSASIEQRRAYGVWLEQERKRWRSEEEFLRAASNPTWTEVAPSTTDSAKDSLSCMSLKGFIVKYLEKRKIQVMNHQFFEELMKKQCPPEVKILVLGNRLEKILRTSGFFMDFGSRLAVGKKIAQRGQAEIYEALFDGKKAITSRRYFGRMPEGSLVLKVFPLEHSEWFRGAWANESKSIYMQNDQLRNDPTCCFVMNCTLLKDGRFAFLMRRYWGDLRKAINIQKLKDKTHLKPPFPPSISTNIMYQIAMGMYLLHGKGTLHRDLKATNVLVRDDIETSMRLFENGLDGIFFYDVADFESVEGVMGTGFWRAPEVLGILKSSAEDKYTNPTIWTEKVDVYAYAMTCYEVLSGCIPFQFRGANDYNIGDERPPLPDYVDQEVQDLLKRCWDSEPSKRPSFDIICDELIKFAIKKEESCLAIAEDERDADAKEWLRWLWNYYHRYQHSGSVPLTLL